MILVIGGLRIRKNNCIILKIMLYNRMETYIVANNKWREQMVKHQQKYINSNDCIVHETETRMIVNTSMPHANMMHDGSRPFAVCVKIPGSMGRVSCMGRYETLAKAKAALKYLK